MQRIYLRSKQVIDYKYLELGEVKHLYILLHGFKESGEKILNTIKSTLPENCAILSPNGNFPLPYRTETGINYTFSWYFFDSKNKKYYIDQAVAVDSTKQLISHLEIDNLPKTIIGYSQGGYLAPFLGVELSKVEKVIGINSEFKHALLPEKMSFKLINICHKHDPLVDFENVYNSNKKILANNNNIEIHSLDLKGHAIEDLTLRALKECL